jgi:hypothetical protein
MPRLIGRRQGEPRHGNETPTNGKSKRRQAKPGVDGEGDSDDESDSDSGKDGDSDSDNELGRDGNSAGRGEVPGGSWASARWMWVVLWMETARLGVERRVVGDMGRCMGTAMGIGIGNGMSMGVCMGMGMGSAHWAQAWIWAWAWAIPHGARSSWVVASGGPRALAVLARCSRGWSRAVLARLPRASSPSWRVGPRASSRGNSPVLARFTRVGWASGPPPGLSSRGSRVLARTATEGPFGAISVWKLVIKGGAGVG